MQVEQVSCKSALVPCGIEGIDYTVNPYTGCQHACKYCYADFMKRFSNHLEDKWGSFVDAKVNIIQVLEKELKTKKPGRVWLSSVTDPYQPLEEKFKLTKWVLEAFVSNPKGRKFSLEVLSKSSLMQRDFKLLKELNAEIGFSIGFLSPQHSKVIEPFSSPCFERIKALKKAHNAGLRTYGFIAPVIPGITNLEELFSKLNFVDSVFVEMLNTKPSVLQRMLPLMRKHFPQELEEWGLLLNDKQAYYNNLVKEVKDLETQFDLKVEKVIMH